MLDNLGRFKKNKKMFGKGPKVVTHSVHTQIERYSMTAMSFGVAGVVIYFMGPLFKGLLFGFLSMFEEYIEMIPDFAYTLFLYASILAILQYPLVNGLILRKVKYDKWFMDKAADQILAYDAYPSSTEMFLEFDSENVAEQDIERFVREINEDSDAFRYQFKDVDFSSSILVLKVSVNKEKLKEMKQEKKNSKKSKKPKKDKKSKKQEDQSDVVGIPDESQNHEMLDDEGEDILSSINNEIDDEPINDAPHVENEKPQKIKIAISPQKKNGDHVEQAPKPKIKMKQNIKINK